MLQVEAYSAIGGRSKNEDNITGWHKGDNMCFLVADGLGGHGDGDLASKEAIMSYGQLGMAKFHLRHGSTCWSFRTSESGRYRLHVRK